MLFLIRAIFIAFLFGKIPAYFSPKGMSHIRKGSRSQHITSASTYLCLFKVNIQLTEAQPYNCLSDIPR